jgi:enamine deaminase RidA (YjgF/YER057c/UK114 family)
MLRLPHHLTGGMYPLDAEHLLVEANRRWYIAEPGGTGPTDLPRRAEVSDVSTEADGTKRLVTIGGRVYSSTDARTGRCSPEAYGGPMDRRHARSGSPYEDRIGFSRAVRVGNIISVAGTAPVWPDGEVDPDPAVQAHRCWEIALAALEELDGRVEDVIRTRMYVVDAEVAEAVGAVHGVVFGEVRPASTMVVVAGLLDPRWVVEIELDAIVG